MHIQAWEREKKCKVKRTVLGRMGDCERMGEEWDAFDKAKLLIWIQLRHKITN